MSQVSLEAESGRTSPEDPQRECEESDKAEESLSEGLKQESVDNSRTNYCSDEEMYEIDINSGEEKAEKGVKDGEKEEDIQNESVGSFRDVDAAPASGSVDQGAHVTNHVEAAETPEEGGDSHMETKVILTLILMIQTLRASLLASLLQLPCCAGVTLLFPYSFALVAAVCFLHNEIITFSLCSDNSYVTINCVNL